MSRKRLFSVIIAAFVIAGLQATSVLSVAADTHEGPQDHEFADGAFEDRWERTDLGVLEGETDRTWVWGPSPFTEGMMEPYADSPGGQRLVQYFDKSRMEINHPDQPQDDLWYVTNGLLVVEMVDGKYQIGDFEFDESPEPADIQIAGDPDAGFGPTYADINQFGLRHEPALDTGEVITQTVSDTGEVTTDERFAEYGVTADRFVEETGHTVASPFWEFMTSEGEIWDGDAYVTGDLFPNPFYAVGFPITEAYWNVFEVAGTERDVLWQCFERRCLTYTPGNPEGFVVEAGNVGQHYYRWRYLGEGNGDGNGDETQAVEIFLVSPDDGGPVGCGDTLVPVEVEIEATDDTAVKVERALAALFAIDEQMYGESGLYNALYQSNLAVQSVVIENGQATVEISGEAVPGGVCDEPRIVEQIRSTVLGIEGVETANITVNGTPIDDLFGGSGDGVETVQNFYVILEDDGENGIPIGCGDSLVGIDVEIEASDDVATRIERALAPLLANDDPTTEEGYYNALAESDLSIASVEFTQGLANVYLEGEALTAGTCDDPRFIEQLRQTVLQFDEVQVANVWINGEFLNGYFSPAPEPNNLEGGVLAAFDVEGEVFQVWVTNETTIDQILALQSGGAEGLIPNGRIQHDPGLANYNLPWSWHLDPEDIEMSEVNIETCDGLPSYVEENIDEFVDNIERYCPWSAELIHVEDLRAVDDEA